MSANSIWSIVWFINSLTGGTASSADNPQSMNACIEHNRSTKQDLSMPHGDWIAVSWACVDTGTGEIVSEQVAQ